MLGSAKAIALAAREPSLRIVSIAQTHDPARIEAMPDFVCVNSALEVDLLGQVNVETAGGRHVGAIGGSVDFLRAATRSPGGHSIVALPAATSHGRPRIVRPGRAVSASAPTWTSSRPSSGWLSFAAVRRASGRAGSSR